MTPPDSPAKRTLRRWPPPEVEVIPFQAKRRTGKIRRTAELMGCTTQRGADAVWRQAIDGMRRQMERSGIADARIEAELQDFAEAVKGELVRRRYGFTWFDGGDAA